MTVAPVRSCRPVASTDRISHQTDFPAQPSPSLEELIAASAHGDEQAFLRLYRATSDVLFGVAVRLLKRSDWAEEVLQESFVSVWRHAARYDRTRGAPMTWLIRIVRNQSFDWISSVRFISSVPLAEQALTLVAIDSWVSTI